MRERLLKMFPAQPMPTRIIAEVRSNPDRDILIALALFWVAPFVAVLLGAISK